ncbi:MAG: TetR/AcrR family transcriptional regulator [Proteobacteria bacterium]|nr:TetR/AcrR family transcriptional regulator [Pseudomonadota bacterium]
MAPKPFEALKAREREDRRQALADIAEGLLAEKGPEGVTVRDVARIAGLSVGSIYMYFKTKEELFCFILIQRLSALRDRLALQEPGSGPAAALKAMATDYRDYYLACGRHLDAVRFAPGPRGAYENVPLEMIEELRGVLGEILSLLERFLAAPALAPLLRGLPPSRAVPVLWSLITGIARVTLSAPRAPESGTDFDRVLADAVLLFLGPDALDSAGQNRDKEENAPSRSDP